MPIRSINTDPTGQVEQSVEKSFGAAAATLKPTDHVVNGVLGGHFSAAFPTGAVTGRSAADVLLGFRWASPSKLCLIRRITCCASVVTAQAATVQDIDWDLIRATNITVNYVTGSTKQAFNNTSHKLRSTHAPTDLVSYGDVYAATTGAATGQTATLDSIPLSYACVPTAAPTATYAGNLGQADLWKADKQGDHPLVLAANEGFAIRVGTAQGATVAVKSVFVVEWSELASY